MQEVTCCRKCSPVGPEHAIRRIAQVVLPFFFIILAHASVAQISGTVYRDFNEDGVRSYTATALGEIGVGGVGVNVYTSTGLAGTAITSSATASAGSYTVTVTGPGPFRVEFVNLPTGYFDGLRGTASGTSVQFVAGLPATDVNLGINYPSDYCQTNPDLIVPCYINGNSLGTGNAAERGVLIRLPYASRGDTPTETVMAINKEIGTVYGVAYQRTTKLLFTAALVKRHAGLGPGGAGAIYVTKPGSGTASTSSLFTTLPTAETAITPTGSTIVASNAARGLPDASNTLNHDPTTFDQVGKAGLGDIEISDDGTQLYVVNLGDRKLYQIPVVAPAAGNPTAGTPTGFPLPEVAQAAGSVFRPFGLKYYRGLVYIGGVTTNEAVSNTLNMGTGSTGGSMPLVVRDTSGMKAVVFAFDPARATFTQVLSFPLTYRKGPTNNDQTGVSLADRWLPWTDVEPAAGTIPNRYARNDGSVSYPQPMLAGIEFDVDGSMILSIRDRLGDQYGINNYGVNTADKSTLFRAISPGDILRAGKCDPAVNQWTLEQNARICGGIATAGAGTNQGPGGGEYYYGDGIALPNFDNPFHSEMSEGSLALLPGRDEVASIVLNPTYNIEAGGIRRFKNSDGSGAPTTSVQLYAGGNVDTYGKANGLGDLELNCDLPPIEIGNRVWQDNNNNGVQDPGEPGLAGVRVVLHGPGSTPLATATTNATGEYYFSSAAGTSTASSVANLPLTAGGSYTLSFPASVNALALSTRPRSATGSNAGAIDSDAAADGSIAITLGNAGENNFTLDVGYACNPVAFSLSSATVCAGQQASLTATGCDGGTVAWSTSETSAGILVAPATTTIYSATCTLATGCYSTTATTVTVNPVPVYTVAPQSMMAGCTGTVANNDAQIRLTTLQHTDRAGIAPGSNYDAGPAYGAATNLMVTSGAVTFLNLPNPGTSQPYTIRLYSTGGTCYTDVRVVVEPTFCSCPPPVCVPVVIQKVKRTVVR